MPWNIVLGSQGSATNNLDIGGDSAGDVLTLNGVVSSPDGYGVDVWPATSTVKFGASNTYTGLTEIWGTLQLGVADALKSGNDVTVQAGGVFDLNGFAQSLGGLSGSGGVATGGAALTVGAGNSSSTFAGVISETGSLIKTGSGTFTLTVKIPTPAQPQSTREPYSFTARLPMAVPPTT